MKLRQVTIPTCRSERLRACEPPPTGESRLLTHSSSADSATLASTGNPIKVGVADRVGCGWCDDGFVSGSQFKDEDDLTRKFKLAKEYQVFVKMDKRVPGTRCVCVCVCVCVCGEREERERDLSMISGDI